jgi:hypothetical protein
LVRGLTPSSENRLAPKLGMQTVFGQAFYRRGPDPEKSFAKTLDQTRRHHLP